MLQVRVSVPNSTVEIMSRMNRLVIALVVGLLLVSPQVLARTDPDCPDGASASALFQILDEFGRPVDGANLLFTAANWDSTLSQLSDASGSVDLTCVPAGQGYDVTVLSSGKETTHVTVDASERPRRVRIIMRHREGRYVRVTLSGAPIPGVIVTITDSDGKPQKFQTDHDGVARHPPLTGDREAIFEVALGGFVSQRAHLPHDRKNGPVLFEMSLIPVCTPMRIQ
jgi:hypothetical protein